MSYFKFSKIPLEINWHEGMLLSQHHFQQNDLRIMELFALKAGLGLSNFFGVSNIVVDKMALSDGIYRINEIDAIFPDGLIFNFCPQKYNNLRPLEINLTANVAADLYEFPVFLCVAAASEKTSPILGNPARYYSIEVEATSDYNIKDNTAKIPRLVPNVFLHIGESIPEFCVGFPVSRIMRTEGLFRLKDWTSPCFYIEKDFSIWKKCSILVASIREKVAFLSEKLQNQTGSALSYDTEKILSNLLSILPSFEVLVFSENIKPFLLYQQLAVVLGVVATLIPTDIVPVIQPYNHNDIDGCMYQIIKLIDHYMLSVERGYALVQFSKKDRFYYNYVSTEMLDKFSTGNLYIGIRGGDSNDFAGVEKWMRDAVIVSDFALETVREKRVKGANREKATQDIIFKIMPGMGVALFEVEINPNFIKSEQNLHIFNPGAAKDNHPVEIILYIPRKKG